MCVLGTDLERKRRGRGYNTGLLSVIPKWYLCGLYGVGWASSVKAFLILKHLPSHASGLRISLLVWTALPFPNSLVTLHVFMSCPSPLPLIRAVLAHIKQVFWQRWDVLPQGIFMPCFTTVVETYCTGWTCAFILKESEQCHLNQRGSALGKQQR